MIIAREGKNIIATMSVSEGRQVVDDLDNLHTILMELDDKEPWTETIHQLFIGIHNAADHVEG